MNITVNQKKKEMREDPLVNMLVSVQTWIKAKSVVLVGVLVAVLFAALVYGGFIWIQNRGTKSAQEAFGKAVTAYATQDIAKAVELFTIVAENHKSSPHAAYSAYMLGTIFLDQGKNDEAIQWLKTAESRKNGTGFVHGAAAEALSSAYEAKGDMALAGASVQEALKDPLFSYRYPALRWKLALISKELNRPAEAVENCKRIIGDTLSVEYHQKAGNLLVELQSKS